MIKEAQLKIFYTGKRKPEPQGKIFTYNGELIYLADMTPNKWVRNGQGYAIADQVVKAFKKLKINPTILYRRKDLKSIYKADRHLFIKKGYKVTWGGHEQWVLALTNFGYHDYFDDETTSLPSMTVSKWLQPETPPVEVHPANMDQYIDSRRRLKEIFMKII